MCQYVCNDLLCVHVCINVFYMRYRCEVSTLHEPPPPLTPSSYPPPPSLWPFPSYRSYFCHTDSQQHC